MASIPIRIALAESARSWYAAGWLASCMLATGFASWSCALRPYCNKSLRFLRFATRATTGACKATVTVRCPSAPGARSESYTLHTPRAREPFDPISGHDYTKGQIHGQILKAVANMPKF